MRITRVLGGGLVASVVAVVGLVAGPGIGPAGADCSGPTLAVAPATAAPGQRITIAGTYFGTDCNDTGRPGPVLGTPQRDIELWVQVGEGSRQVAVVDAGSGYDFAIDVAVPPSLGVGAAEVQARSAEGVLMTARPAPFDVVGDPIGSADLPVVQQPATDGTGGGVPWGWVGLGAVVGAVLALGTVAVVGRRS